jgi:hypothetical protein
MLLRPKAVEQSGSLVTVSFAGYTIISWRKIIWNIQNV